MGTLSVTEYAKSLGVTRQAVLIQFIMSETKRISEMVELCVFT